METKENHCPKCDATDNGGSLQDLIEERIAQESITIKGERKFYVKIKTRCLLCGCTFVQLYRSEYVTSHILEENE